MDNQCGEKEKKAKDIQEEGGERMCERKNKSEEKMDGKGQLFGLETFGHLN